MSLLFHPGRDDITLPNVLYALGDPIRLAIVRRVARADEPTCAETVPHPVPKSTLSHHLRILREAGIIYARKQGREYHNSLRRAELDSLFPGLLDAVLNALEEAEPASRERVAPPRPAVGVNNPWYGWFSLSKNRRDSPWT